MNRTIRKVAVLGSGVMGSQIACHLANVGLKVLLLDLPAGNGSEGKVNRNQIVNNALAAAVKMNPSPLYSKKRLSYIQTGNFEDDLPAIRTCDWILEAVVEKREVKQQLFEAVETYRRPGTLVSSNTSGIPIHSMCAGRSADFRQHFCGTHFFNPPRYLKLLEIIPTEETLPEVTAFFLDYGERHLGKTTVRCNDTPGFIGNRIGVFSMASIFQYVEEAGLRIEEADKLTGTLIGRPKSATFRTADVVGLDTLLLVATGLAKSLGSDSPRAVFDPPAYLKEMIGRQWLGSKSGQGFYKKQKVEGKSVIQVLDLQTMTYRPAEKVRLPELEQAVAINELRDRFPILLADEGRVGRFYRHLFYGLFEYASNCIPEISADFYPIDDAMEAGFGWQMGPFKIWDALGVERTTEAMAEAGFQAAGWVREMLTSGKAHFYQKAEGKGYYYDIAARDYRLLPGNEKLILLANLGGKQALWSNADARITDLGDGILNLSFHSKLNTIGGGTLAAINKAIDLAESDFRGLVVYNEGEQFSAGANVGLIFMMAAEQEFEELDYAIRQFQQTMMRIRYSAVPVVAAPHNMALGGGCELCLHADKVVAHAELYMGLVEFGVGLIPGGGGTKEFALRLSESLQEGDIVLNNFRERLLTIGQAKVSGSAEEAFDLGYLRPGRDLIVLSRKHQLTEAKAQCLRLAENGYTRPVERRDITVLGNTALGLAYLGAASMREGRYISAHDEKISRQLAYVMSGGDLSAPTEVSEQYLLDLERAAFLRLCTERKTLERLQSVIKGGKVLRN